MNNLNMLLAGFGGQGVLFAGKVIAYGGLMDEKEISWLPSYGPEMRGGTANCSVCISDEPIGSPLVLNPNVFIAMNLPSFDKFINDVEPGGLVIIDSALIHKKVEREDVKAFYVPATTLEMCIRDSSTPIWKRAFTAPCCGSPSAIRRCLWR